MLAYALLSVVFLVLVLLGSLVVGQPLLAVAVLYLCWFFHLFFGDDSGCAGMNHRQVL